MPRTYYHILLINFYKIAMFKFRAEMVYIYFEESKKSLVGIIKTVNLQTFNSFFFIPKVV